MFPDESTQYPSGAAMDWALSTEKATAKGRNANLFMIVSFILVSGEVRHAG
jgi:hypothetical protein